MIARFGLSYVDYRSFVLTVPALRRAI
ncbi:hypothetical protein CUJ84_pRLN1000074 (plasmid) [Rhizobium leguminosarum]|uniref:Uncharacterized protein n=1 Tax=Rhizobium leguminosarum TaxID=384 RepID=A0A2K9ZBD0_RHILE|nr:hypothetical protein CUJ84_pRLN1000074 [Rhizobium leguminosarum]